MTLHLHNTASGNLEEFRPIDAGRVRMYHCGPTVYNYPHIGNLRTYTFWDILRRVLEADYEVMQVMNITDFGHLTGDSDEGEDKMMKGLVREGLPVTMEGMRALGEKYAKAFVDDLESLNIKLPHSLPRASDYINEDIALIKLLEERGFIYTTSDGVYFDTAKDPNYGKKLKGAASGDQARIEGNPEKKNPRDFALWKFNESLGWESPWGKGFPGWHIECSAMSSSHLGTSFDIHTGGIDHIAIHHTNEIAQSENAFGETMANYWLHANFLNIKGEKLSKSLSNEILLSDIREKGFSVLALRYFILGAHYRSEQNFTWEALEAAANAWNKLSMLVDELGDRAEASDVDPDSRARFEEALHDDLNTPKALAALWDVARSSLPDSVKLATLLHFDRFLGLGLGTRRVALIPERIRELVDAREEARIQKAWDKADEIRAHIEELGYTVKDTESGPRILPR